MNGNKIGTGVLSKDPDFPGSYLGDVVWYGFPIGVCISREGDGVRCDFFERQKPDWATIPLIDNE